MNTETVVSTKEHATHLHLKGETGYHITAVRSPEGCCGANVREACPWSMNCGGDEATK